MRTERKLADADLILDELDRLARSADGNEAFWEMLLAGVCSVLGCSDAAVLIPVSDHWTAVASQGVCTREDIQR
ncbi:MAG: hypothetical protein MUF23_13650, partial [Pirellula sp.]|nr:hypothetical protein [Pirellula sp.]